MKKSIYFVQANPIYGSEKKSTYLPYAAGCLLSYAFTDKIIRENYAFERFIYIKENIEEAVASMKEPFLVAFSCCVWNMEYNLALAKKVKEKYPDCVIIFGGHQVSADGGELAEYPYIDFVMHNGGEKSFRELLLFLTGIGERTDIVNISYKDENGNIQQNPLENPKDITDFPSPYLDGWFDSIIDDDFAFSAIIETNRGCPNKCAFCDWGVLHKKVLFFPIERVMAELQWIADKKIEYIFCGDGNFGLFDRDLDIANEVVRLKKEYGYPQKFRVSFTKNRVDMIETISKLFHENNIGKSQTLSFQSLSPVVLENIGRKNISLDYFASLMKSYNRDNISVFSELILGLPGETYESFCEGICLLLEKSQHRSISVYPCELLPNSRMGSKEYIEKFQLQWVRTPFNAIHCNPISDKDTVEEFTNFVVSTNTMTKSDWARAAVFSSYIQALHNFGVLRFVAMYLRREKNIPYVDFYSSLLDYFEKNPDTFSGKLYGDILSYADGVTKSKNAWACQRKGFGEICWGFEEIAALEIIFNQDKFNEEILDFLKNFNIEKEVLGELMKYQTFIIKKLNSDNLKAEFNYDFYDYFRKISMDESTTLLKKKTVLTSHDICVVGSKEEYAKKVIWFGRRDGLTVLSDNNQGITKS